MFQTIYNVNALYAIIAMRFKKKREIEKSDPKPKSIGDCLIVNLSDFKHTNTHNSQKNETL